jgi:hypothetical protein
MEMVRKPVAFNLADPDQARMLEHAKKRPNFSGYVKRLIQRDMEGNGGFIRVPPAQKCNTQLMQGLI